ncbi:MAG: hypothetical protein ACTHOO_02785 [Alcanivorax sp.]
MRPDYDKYIPMLDEYDMTHQQKIEFIDALWNVMQSFVDHAFGVHPTQQVMKQKAQRNLQSAEQILNSSNTPENA